MRKGLIKWSVLMAMLTDTSLSAGPIPVTLEVYDPAQCRASSFTISPDDVDQIICIYIHYYSVSCNHDSTFQPTYRYIDMAIPVVILFRVAPKMHNVERLTI